MRRALLDRRWPYHAQTAGLASRIFGLLQSRDDGAKPTTLSRSITLP